MKNIQIEISAESVQKIYRKMEKALPSIRNRFNRPLTFSEKILFSHCADIENQEFDPGKGILRLQPDRIAMQDATAQMAILQFAQAQLGQVCVPTTIHCDHLICAQKGAEEDLKKAFQSNQEVYDFLQSASNKYGIGFWKPGSGIIHQIVFENYAFPGGLMLGTDSHTPNAGGLGMIAIGVGGADAVDVMAGLHWEVKHPKLIGVKLTGELTGWTSPKDVILYLCGLLTVKGGTDKIIEYFGPGTQTISCTGKSTITNMGAELGATTSVFPFDDRMAIYLKSTNRADISELAQKNKDLLKADEEVYKNPEKFFDQVVEIDLSKLEPYLAGPHSPDLARPISKLSREVKEKNYPEKISAVLIGSCTNSSYEDLSRANEISQQAKAMGIKTKSKLFISPGSDQIFETIKRDGQLKGLEEIGAKLFANACGPCIGQWKREEMKSGEKNSIVTTFNRNFRARNDGNPETMAFIGSPEIAVALALSENLGFNPATDDLELPDGKKMKLNPPKKADEVPQQGFVLNKKGYIPPAQNGKNIKIEVNPKSERLQLLDPFPKWDGKDFEKLPVLLKVKGKCTTDHISPAGEWLKYRGHLDRISNNIFLGATNIFADEPGKGTNLLTNEKNVPLPQITRHYKKNHLKWVVIGDENYGEGSSREHAAMSPRYLGIAAVIVRSFARIHETNLKKQGVIPFTFANTDDYNKIQEKDRVTISELNHLSPNSEVKALIHHEDGKTETIQLKHSMTQEQIEWFKAGSALNALKTKI